MYILEMEICIMGLIGWKFVGGGLLIDECYDVGKKWDRFVYGVKCIMVRFVHGIGD